MTRRRAVLAVRRRPPHRATRAGDDAVIHLARLGPMLTVVDTRVLTLIVMAADGSGKRVAP